jgi:hypothetical protein
MPSQPNQKALTYQKKNLINIGSFYKSFLLRKIYIIFSMNQKVKVTLVAVIFCWKYYNDYFDISTKGNTLCQQIPFLVAKHCGTAYPHYCGFVGS